MKTAHIRAVLLGAVLSLVPGSVMATSHHEQYTRDPFCISIKLPGRIPGNHASLPRFAYKIDYQEVSDKCVNRTLNLVEAPKCPPDFPSLDRRAGKDWCRN